MAARKVTKEQLDQKRLRVKKLRESIAAAEGIYKAQIALHQAGGRSRRPKAPKLGKRRSSLRKATSDLKKMEAIYKRQAPALKKLAAAKAAAERARSL